MARAPESARIDMRTSPPIVELSTRLYCIFGSCCPKGFRNSSGNGAFLFNRIREYLPRETPAPPAAYPRRASSIFLLRHNQTSTPALRARLLPPQASDTLAPNLG